MHKNIVSWHLGEHLKTENYERENTCAGKNPLSNEKNPLSTLSST